jgi:TATA-box binding protein (TBP) (component of TFIID and TFIIIB)
MALIRNVITSLTFDRHLDLDAIAADCILDTHWVLAFGALNLKYGTSFCQLYKTGKAFVNGGKSEQEAAALAEFYSEILHHIVPGLQIKEQRIVNIVATYNHGSALDLQRFVAAFRKSFRQHQHCVLFEPEIFPAVKWRMDDLTVHVFHTGKCVLLGAKSEASIVGAVSRLMTLFDLDRGY